MSRDRPRCRQISLMERDVVMASGDRGISLADFYAWPNCIGNRANGTLVRVFGTNSSHPSAPQKSTKTHLHARFDVKLGHHPPLTDPRHSAFDIDSHVTYTLPLEKEFCDRTKGYSGCRSIGLFNVLFSPPWQSLVPFGPTQHSSSRVVANSQGFT
jgi:hypothetical protein